MKRFFSILLGLSILAIAGSDRFYRIDDKKVVVDTTTNLMWQDDEDSNTTKRTWIDAINYCDNLTLGNYSDWRLPNFNELYDLSYRDKADPALDDTFINVSSIKYWSSTTVVKNEDLSWGINFYDGSGFWSGKTHTNAVRCVRVK